MSHPSDSDIRGDTRRAGGIGSMPADGSLSVERVHRHEWHEFGNSVAFRIQNPRSAFDAECVLVEQGVQTRIERIDVELLVADRQQRAIDFPERIVPECRE